MKERPTARVMGYYIDLSTIGIDEYRELLAVADLIPSRRLLQEDLVGNFDRIQGAGIGNLQELLSALKTKSALHEFAATIDIDEHYLAVLSREIRSNLPKPNKISDFPGVTIEDVHLLEAIGIKNTRQLYDRITTAALRDELSSETGIEPAMILRLTRLTDLSRIRWVNHTFAYVLLEAGYQTAEEVGAADHGQMYERVKQLNDERQIYKGHIGLHDMKLCVDAAQMVPQEIAF